MNASNSVLDFQKYNWSPECGISISQFQYFKEIWSEFVHETGYGSDRMTGECKGDRRYTNDAFNGVTVEDVVVMAEAFKACGVNVNDEQN